MASKTNARRYTAEAVLDRFHLPIMLARLLILSSGYPGFRLTDKDARAIALSITEAASAFERGEA